MRATLLPALLGALVPWAMMHHHATRTFALLMLQARLLCHGVTRFDDSTVEEAPQILT